MDHSNGTFLLYPSSVVFYPLSAPYSCHRSFKSIHTRELLPSLLSTPTHIRQSLSHILKKMGLSSSKSRNDSSHLPQSPPTSARSPPASASVSEESSDLSSYQTACEEDSSLRAFDSTLQSRTTKAINSVAGNLLDHRSLSLDSLREVTLCFLDMNQEVVSLILESKKDVWKDPDLFDLVKDYLENSRHTMNFCTALEEALRRAYHSQSILKYALQRFEEEESTRINCPGHDPIQLYSKTLEEFKKFKEAGDPFSQKFFSLFQSVYRQQESMLGALRAKKRRLDKKLHKVKSWKRLSNAIFAAVFVSVLICSVVAAAVTAPPVVTALAAAASVPLGSVGKWINTMWRKYEKDLKREREILTAIEAGSFTVIQDLENVQVLVDKLQIQIEELLGNAGFAMEQRGEGVGGVVENIKKKVSSFMETIEVLSEHAEKCSKDIRMANAIILKKMNEPSGSRSRSAGNGMFFG
ncbi:unnamed protein product [Cuscuta epithymum]|uniref:Uncharacterized protein n=1 Tax=Cuscuta epithymum TaxID=186058 RepID=A0AAV0DLN6_9ASTE|nr:unnamed protein product [Cuscuta epithymum]